LKELVNSLFQSAIDRPLNTAIELALIGIIVYAVLRFLHGTRGARLLQGLITLLVVGFLVVRVVAETAGLDRISVLYEPFAWFVVLTTLVVFQPELRRGLMRLGETRFRRGRRSEIDAIARPVSTSCTWLSKNKIGALIAVEGQIGLSGLTDEGIRLDAKLTPELLNTIFWPGSALHDLGVVLQQGRIGAAGVQFPLGDAEGVDRSIGSRHRAAIGLSLESDAVVVVVSEETGAISIAERGHLYSHIPPDALFKTLRRHLSRQHRTILPPDEETERLTEPEDERSDEDTETSPSQTTKPPRALDEPIEAVS
jgi:diadenylate cyclase